MSRRLKRSLIWSSLIFAAVLAGMTAAISPAAAAKGSLTMAHGGSLRSIDPQLTYGAYEMRALRHVYEPLLDLDASGEKLIPVLAESWRISPDGLTYTFKLRPGVKFANGEPFDAKAVLATIERGKTDKKLGFNFIYSAIEKASSPDPSTVILKTEKLQAGLLYNLTGALMMPANAAAFVGKNYDQPNGTGPFKVAQYVANDRLVLEARPDYWQPGLPKVQRLTLRVINEESARLAAAQAGEIEIAEGLGAQFQDTIKGDPQLALLVNPIWRSEFVGFNCTRPPLDNAKVRQAIAYAINREALVKNVIQVGAPLASYPMKGVLGYSAKIPANPYDLAKARALLAEAGQAKGFKANLLVAAGNVPKIEEMSEYFAAELKKIGIDVELKMQDSAGAGQTRAAGNYDMYIISTAVITGDPDRYFDDRVVRDTYAKQGCAAKRPDLVKMIQEAGQTMDPAKRQGLYERIQDAMWADPPFVWFNQTAWVYAVSKRVKNFRPSPTTLFTLQDVSVE